MDRYIDDSGERELAAAGEENHWGSSRPVISRSIQSIGLPARLCQFPGFDENCPCIGHNDELGDPRAPDNLERLIAEIDQQHADFAAIIGIDRSRRVEHGDAVIAREPGPRPTWAS